MASKLDYLITPVASAGGARFVSARLKRRRMIDLRLGDCLTVMETLPSQMFDAIITDLPYGVTACKWDVVIPFVPMWEQLKRLAKEKAAIVLFGSEPFSSYLRLSNIEWFKYDWIWDKVRPSGFQIAKYAPMKRHEIISVFCSSTPYWNPQKEKRDRPGKGRVCSRSDSSPIKYNDGVTRVYPDKNPQSIIVFNKPASRDYVHPTQKPIQLMEYLIRTYTNVGGTVLDFAMGSGTTMTACKRTLRNGVGIEKEKKYLEIAKQRLAAESERTG